VWPPLKCAERQEIPVKTDVIEAVEAMWTLDEHAARAATAVPIVDLKLLGTNACAAKAPRHEPPPLKRRATYRRC
jgi:hypothetical protein